MGKKKENTSKKKVKGLLKKLEENTDLLIKKQNIVDIRVKNKKGNEVLVATIYLGEKYIEFYEDYTGHAQSVWELRSLVYLKGFKTNIDYINN